jgi:site-specific DNA recombinase
LKYIKTKADRLEERYISEEINRDMFEKYQAKFNEDIKSIQQELGKVKKGVSNPEKCIENAVDFASKLANMWDLANYQGKQKLQYLVFPDGIYFNKKTDGCRTENINQFLFSIGSISSTLSQKKTGISQLNLSYSSSVHRTSKLLNLFIESLIEKDNFKFT